MDLSFADSLSVYSVGRSVSCVHLHFVSMYR